MTDSMTPPSEGTGVPDEIRRLLVSLSRTPHLLVASDYDGTMAPIVSDPSQARPIAESMTAIRRLAGLPQTSAAVISGRSLRDLAVLSRLPEEVHLVGSHGLEFDAGFSAGLTPEQRRLLANVTNGAREIADQIDGVQVEEKPASTAVHFRNVADIDRDRAQRMIEDKLVGVPGLQVTHGKAVVEFAVIEMDKGYALDKLRHQTGASAVIFLGDDVTDEKGFARLRGPDVGIKVGAGETLAGCRIDSPHTAAQVLAMLVGMRQNWLFGNKAIPIERHSLLANGRGHALMTPRARVTWQCHPQVDSAAIFADVVGGESAGHFSIVPGNSAAFLGQRYLDDSMVLETRYAGVSIVDYLAGDTEPGRTDLVRVINGSGTVRIEFAPRPEFGQIPARIQRQQDGLRVFGTNEAIVLRSPGVIWDLVDDAQHTTAIADVALGDAPLILELRCGTDDLTRHATDEPTRRALTAKPWQDFLDALTLPEVARGAVARSALTLKALCNNETGAIIAAATTSLPESIGGVRNWDYRYCWIRDASMTASALVDLGSISEAEAFLHWLVGVLHNTAGPEWLHPLYTIHGNHLTPEASIEELSGYAGSRPVRIGNAANTQLQLDVFGPVAVLIRQVAEHKGALTAEQLEVLGDMVLAVERRWHEPDHGIWEIRDEPRNHVYSRVQGWLTVDCAIAVNTQLGVEVPEAWVKLRDEIRADVLSRGYNEEVGSFTASYEQTDVDASALWVGLSGMLDPSDQRFVSTVAEIERQLRSGPTVYRYRFDDGLPGTEGGFHICTTWLIESMLLIGRLGDARELFDALLDTVGPTGLMAEQWDPVNERSLGNHPQAYSHLGVIRCARLFDQLGGRHKPVGTLASELVGRVDL
ncbi:trehalose 6-phosphatase [Antricoccus suffuscus]|uniref:Trehalose 6-phosphatase n=1 Tax=Antricoccus suffuscus TaxID=1629062 RepID=A0A2T1A529_9ACTN|nr:trehalose-phosphatase [Antricoccus suffuscus]PRZ43712.1 trehalose 6-phosphatase [Antricoccus suffuscus]